MQTFLKYTYICQSFLRMLQFAVKSEIKHEILLFQLTMWGFLT